jgi:GYF domain 2
MMSVNQWYFSRNNGKDKSGPHSSVELKELTQSGHLKPTDLVQREGMEKWVPASRVKGLFDPKSGASQADIEPAGPQLTSSSLADQSDPFAAIESEPGQGNYPRKRNRMSGGLVISTAGFLLAAAVIGVFWAVRSQESSPVPQLAEEKHKVDELTGQADREKPNKFDDSKERPEQLQEQRKAEERRQQQREAEERQQQQREADERKAEELKQQERNQELRAKLLADVDAKKKEESIGLEQEVKKLARVVVDLEEKIAKMERTLGISRRTVGGVMIINPGVNPLDPRVKQLQAQLDRLEKQRETAWGERTAAEKKRDTRLAELEQEKRQIQVQYPAPGDPKLIEYKGFIRTPEELAKIKLFEDEHASPQKAADYYVRTLIDGKVLKEATCLKIANVELPAEALVYKLPIKESRTVHYRIIYVSQGGLVNEREAWVNVFALEDGYWYVSPFMKQFHVLGGLK